MFLPSPSSRANLIRSWRIPVDCCTSDGQCVGPGIVENVFDDNLLGTKVCLQLRQRYRIDGRRALQESRGQSSFRILDLIDDRRALARIIGIQ